MNIATPKVLFISWLKYDGRTALLAQHLGIPSYFLHFGPRRRAFWLPLRYLVLAYRTWTLLQKERPDVILVQVPPTPSALIIYIHCKLRNARFVIDTHSGSIKPPWDKLFWLHRFLSMRADTTIVPNDQVGKVFHAYGCRTIRLGFTPGDYHDRKDYPLSKQFNVAVPCSFSDDEPIAEIVKVASRMPDVHFYITGNINLAPHGMIDGASANCHFTGFLDLAEYNGLIAGADAIMDLTTRDDTLLLGAYEAISLNKPLITSHWQLLRDYFSLGTVHVDNTADGIFMGVSEMITHYDTYVEGVKKLKEILETDWNTQLAILKECIYGSTNLDE